MPLVKIVGGSAREDNTEAADMAPGPGGEPRRIVTGGPPMYVSGEELRQLAGHFDVQVLDEPTPVQQDLVGSTSFDPHVFVTAEANEAHMSPPLSASYSSAADQPQGGE